MCENPLLKCGAKGYPVKFCVLLWLNLIHWSSSELGHSSLTLYQGIKKFVLDNAKDCPVGVAFNQPERFSCACINGIWAFYDNPCAPPVAVVGGNHHCFRMPPQPISSIIIVSNPLRALGDSLTVFEDDMDTIRAKFYRNVHVGMDEANGFVSLNSSWTLVSSDGTKSVCLEKRHVIFEGLTSEEAAAFPDLSYCSYVNVSEEIPYIGAIKKGCNSSMILEPTQCQPMLPQTDEDAVCLDNELILSYEDNVQKYLDPVKANNNDEIQQQNDGFIDAARMARALENLGRFATLRRRAANLPVETIPPKYASTYQGEPEWHQRLLQSSSQSQSNRGNVSSSAMSEASRKEEAKGDAKPFDFSATWNDSHKFLSPMNANVSNHLVTNHLWMYYRYAIRNVLNITRLVPPDEDMSIRVDAGKVKKLLKVHVNIMKKICTLAPPSFFEIVTGTFVALLTNGYRWKEPYLEQTHYLRILTTLSICQNNAEALNFVPASSCGQSSNYILMPETNGQGSVNVEVDVPDRFQSKLFEPIIEAVWKIFVAVHSYCFKDFSDQYQDHHKYTTLMMGLFSNQVHDIWMRNKTFGVEYAGVLGNIAKTMQNLEKCTVGARMTSEYPFHMGRPTKLFKFRDESDITTKPRRKRETVELNHGNLQENIPHRRKKRLAINAVNSENVIGHTMFGGRGVCLKKYGDSRSTVGRFCQKEIERRNRQS